MRLELNLQPKHQLFIELPSGATMGDLLTHLAEQYPDLAPDLYLRLYPQSDCDQHGFPVSIFLNRKALRQQEVAAATLRDGDRVHILAPIVGGGALLER